MDEVDQALAEWPHAEMAGHYPGATIKLLDGGDHALSDYAQHLDEVLSFLDLA